MYKQKYTDGHIVNIKSKRGKIIDFDFLADEFCENYEWRKSNSDGGVIIKVDDSGNNPICHCSKNEFQMMEKNNVWRIDDDGVVIENLPIKELSDQQFFELWRDYPECKWELLQGAVNLTNKQLDQYRGWYNDGDDEVVEMVDDQAAAISTAHGSWGKSFTEELDALIASKE